jgi:hypothetical protein
VKEVHMGATFDSGKFCFSKIDEIKEKTTHMALLPESLKELSSVITKNCERLIYVDDDALIEKVIHLVFKIEGEIKEQPLF